MSDSDLWDREAQTFDEAADHGLADPDCREAWRSLLLEHLPPAPARVADLGCGTGTLALLLAEVGARWRSHLNLRTQRWSPPEVEVRGRTSGRSVPGVSWLAGARTSTSG